MDKETKAYEQAVERRKRLKRARGRTRKTGLRAGHKKKVLS